ncbi:MAG: hypothetical protein IIY33_06810 [Erysipelotrichaceae bacterium]|nr:hypothetical protein [Erysipelotrichaceae bacterium]MBQ1522626.1 hypothetical protein [Erysipelotrichaceae bacterium]
MQNKKGFVTIYLLQILAVCLLLSRTMIGEITRYHGFEENRQIFREVNWLEVLAVNRIKQKFRSYREKDEVIYVNGYRISFIYHNLTCNLTISGNGVYRERWLQYDDIDNEVIDYQ